MPQMSPLMWQNLFMLGLFILIVFISKNYFLEIKIVNKTVNVESGESKESSWKW